MFFKYVSEPSLKLSEQVDDDEQRMIDILQRSYLALLRALPNTVNPMNNA
jgi:hypothetical protein